MFRWFLSRLRSGTWWSTRRTLVPGSWHPHSSAWGAGHAACDIVTPISPMSLWFMIQKLVLNVGNGREWVLGWLLIVSQWIIPENSLRSAPVRKERAIFMGFIWLHNWGGPLWCNWWIGTYWFLSLTSVGMENMRNPRIPGTGEICQCCRPIGPAVYSIFLYWFYRLTPPILGLALLQPIGWCATSTQPLGQKSRGKRRTSAEYQQNYRKFSRISSRKTGYGWI